MPSIGDETRRKMQAIIDRIEEVGRVMGVPEEKAIRIVECEYTMRLAERIDAFREEATRWHAEEEAKERKKFDWGRTLRNIASGFVGEFDARNGKK